MFQLQAELEEVFAGAQTSLTSRWTAANWIDKVLFATPSVVPIYWSPGLSERPVWGKCRPIPGLPDQTGYDGIEVFAQHVLLWRGTTIKGSDLNDFAQWIPVGVTASSGRATTAEVFSQPAAGSISGFQYITGRSGSFVVGQYVRIVSSESDASDITYSYYQVDSVVSSDNAVNAINFDFGVPVQASARIYTDSYKAWEAGARVSVDGDSTPLTVAVSSRKLDPVYELAATSSSIPPKGGSITLPLTAFPHELRAGDCVSVSARNEAGQDVYEVMAVGQTLVCKRLGVGESMQAAGTLFIVSPSAAPIYVRFQHWVTVENRSDGSVSVPKRADVGLADGLKLRNLGYSGAAGVGDEIPAGSVVETINTNEAYEQENVGAQINGDILGIVTLADYAYILKSESIQSIQYVGGVSPYTIRGEIFEEGPIGRYAFCRFDNRELIFWGHKGWYRYAGGQVITAVGAAHWDVVLKEIDQSRADEIVAFHNRASSEVWFVYPVLGGSNSKVVVYNYDADSVVVDVYDTSLNGISAIGVVDWEVAPTWESLPDTERFDCVVAGAGTVEYDAGFDESFNSRTAFPDLVDKRWYEYVEDGQQPRTILGIGGDLGNPNNGEDAQVTVPRLLAHGRVFHRASRDDCDPQAYTAQAETPDFDFDDNSLVKYVESVQLELFVPEDRARPMKLWVQLGTRMGLDGKLNWSARRSVEVSGNGNIATRVDLRGAGRFIRLRFISDAEDVQWGISSYTVYARKGGSY